mgnify:CR=1 FL=1
MESIAPLWAIVASGLVLLSIIVLIILIVQMHSRLSKFVKGKDGSSLEATLEWLTQKVSNIDDTLATHKQGLEYIDRRVKRSIRGYSLIRYDAYGAGGAQSFSTGLLDEHGDGFILSVVSNRNHTGVYSKKIIAGNAETSLTEEEGLALAEAKKTIS